MKSSYLKNHKLFDLFLKTFEYLHSISNILKKTKWASEVKYCWSYWLQNMCLFKCKRRLVSGKPLAVNVLTCSKNSLNLLKSTFIRCLYHFDPNWVQVFLKLFTPKDVLTFMPNSSCFWKLTGSERVNKSQKLMKSAKKYYYPNFSSLWTKLSKKKLFLIRFEILGLLDNTLTANYKYLRINRENLPLPT